MATGSFGISPSDLAFLGRLTVVSTHQRFSTFGLLATALVRTATHVPTHLTPSARVVLAGSRDFLRLRALAGAWVAPPGCHERRDAVRWLYRAADAEQVEAARPSCA